MKAFVAGMLLLSLTAQAAAPASAPAALVTDKPLVAKTGGGEAVIDGVATTFEGAYILNQKAYDNLDRTLQELQTARVSLASENAALKTSVDKVVASEGKVFWLAMLVGLAVGAGGTFAVLHFTKK